MEYLEHKWQAGFNLGIVHSLEPELEEVAGNGADMAIIRGIICLVEMGYAKGSVGAVFES